jgi:hypothetical protein
MDAAYSSEMSVECGLLGGSLLCLAGSTDISKKHAVAIFRKMEATFNKTSLST